MQTEIAALRPVLDVKILGIDLPGLESTNGVYTQGVSLPWLQDTAADSVWVKWQANWRDVIVLDKRNQPIEVYNLFDHDLSVAANYAALKNALIAAAKAP